MGVMRFLVPRRERLADDVGERAYLAGIDEIPWLCRARWTGDVLSIERSESDSGNLHIPYWVTGHGVRMLSTASLMERDRPYHLDVELARGTLNRLRNQLAQWDSPAFRLSASIATTIAQAHDHLSFAATRQDDPLAAADRAAQATQLACDAIEMVTASYVTQMIEARHRQSGKIGTLLGVNLGNAVPNDTTGPLISAAFNTALVPIVWRDIEAREGKHDWSVVDEQVEWCRARGLKVCSGPLLQVDKWSLPDWMFLWDPDDDESFRSCTADFIQAVVTRYRGKIQLWQCAAGLNVENEFEHSEEDRLRLAVLTIESIRRVDPRAPIIISIDQPWGSFMSREECDLSPIHFADALVRAELGLAGLGLQINMGYAQHGTEPRDVLDLSRQIDRWSALGLPLLVSLTVPSSTADDPKARIAAKPLNYSDAPELTPDAQRTWVDSYLRVMLGKQPLQGIVWNQLLDSQPHALAHGGLFDAQDRPKPVLEVLQALRRQHLA